MMQAHAARARRRGRRRRAPEVLMIEEARDEVTAKVRRITQASRAKGTKTVYASYLRTLHEWYMLNHPELCTADGKIDANKISEAINVR